ncbi:uncharacterized protein FFB20_15923 [Fusarium fujikuroi]|nr:uncharacterized protein FFB20_15923 [Fusarium fujikuroi]
MQASSPTFNYRLPLTLRRNL